MSDVYALHKDDHVPLGKSSVNVTENYFLKNGVIISVHSNADFFRESHDRSS